MGLAFRHPDIGETVGEYKILEQLGAGGFGVVFKAERAGRFFALKFLGLPRLTGRAKREIGILAHLANPCVVRFIGSDWWPDPVVGHPYVVMEFVEGDTLEQFALKHNPSARRAARIVLDAALTLGEVHKEGVFHRDLKPSNIIIRGKNERPILIDFGVGSLVGASCLTGTSLPPGTAEFRAPEPLHFQRENQESDKKYEFTSSDELWALGVTLYWLLTDVLPFGDRDDGGEEALHERIRTQRPLAPHVLNPRVPLALSRICMKMLEEKPEERYSHVGGVCVALDSALNEARHEERWDVPLCDPDASGTTTTGEDPALKEPDEQKRVLGRWTKHRPRRGRPPPKEAPALPPPAPPIENLMPTVAASPEALQQARAADEQDRIPTVEAPAPEQAAPPTQPAAAPEQPAAAAAPGARLRRAQVSAAVVVTLAAVGLLAGAAVLRAGPSAPAGAERQEVVLLPASPRPGLAGQDRGGREMAPAAKPLEASRGEGEGAAPVMAQPPAPTPTAMLRNNDSRLKPEEKPTPQPQRAGRLSPLKSAAAAGITCALLDGGCTAPASQVRTEPPAITCPQDWRETHKRFKFYNLLHGSGLATVKGYKGERGELFRVKDGPATLQVGVVGGVGDGSVGNLPDGTLLLGQWQLGDNRLFGTFTEAKIPGVGTLPVCLVAGIKGGGMGFQGAGYVDEHGKSFLCPPGLGVCLDPGSTPGNVKTHTRIFLIEPVGQP